MAYRSPNGMAPNNVKALAYVMTVELGRPQAAAAKFFEVAPSTISNWVKEARYLIQIGRLERELADARNQLPPAGGTGGMLIEEW